MNKDSGPEIRPTVLHCYVQADDELFSFPFLFALFCLSQHLNQLKNRLGFSLYNETLHELPPLFPPAKFTLNLACKHKDKRKKSKYFIKVSLMFNKD